MNDTISREAVADAINGIECTRHTTWYEFYQKVMTAVEKLPPAEPKKGKWIPVTEDTLPEENRVVVVCGDKGTWDFGTYRGHGGNIHFWYWKKNTYKRVYWWMYKEDALPEPYKGVTE